MKNKFTKIVSSLLVLAFLVSCMAVFVSADTSTASKSNLVTTTEEDVTLLINRAYDEGWNYANGFDTSKAGKHSYTIEYEETEDFAYNYYCRFESEAASSGYIALSYGANAPQMGGTILEFDIKTDDLCDMGSPILYFTSLDEPKNTYKLAGISSNALTIVSEDELAAASNPSYQIGDIGGEWVHVAFAFSINQRRCPSCGTVYDITPENSSSLECCVDLENPDNTITLSKMENIISVRTYFSYSKTFDVANAIEAPAKASRIDLNSTYYTDMVCPGIKSIQSYYIGMPAKMAAVGHSFCLDNVKLYNGSKVPVNISSKLGYGLNVDVTQAKTEPIIGSAFGKTTMQYISEGLVMKVGYDYCLDENNKRPIFVTDNGSAYGAPVDIDGEIYIPLQAILDWIGYPLYQHDDGLSFDISTEKGSTFITIGRTTATVNGELVELDSAPGMATDRESGEQYIVIAKEDVDKIFAGYYVTYDDMGLMVISEGQNLFNRESDLEIMLDVMKSFLYNKLTGQQYYDAVKDNTNKFQHPYLVADQNQFNSLKNAYNSAEDEDLKAYLDEIIKDAEEVFTKYTTAPVEDDTEDSEEVPGDSEEVPEEPEEPEDTGSSSAYEYLYATITNPYVDLENNGYDIGGRNPFIVECTEDIKLLALAYQITGEERYAILAYEMVYCLTLWNHWAPAYFLHCAEATANIAIAYDWLYNIWTELEYDIALVEGAIYEHGILMGYNFSNGVELNPGLTSNQDVYAIYNTATDSWNVTGTAYMAIASLAILGSDYLNNGFIYNVEATPEEMANKNTTELGYVRTALWLLVNNFDSLVDLGLDMYAPDGSFIESPEYWSAATEALMLMVWSLNNTVGTDLGLINTWGLDKTFYYAYQVEYKVAGGGYDYWNYNEAWADKISTDLAFYAASVLFDETIAAIRKEQIPYKSVSVWDILAYNKDYMSSVVDESKLSLDYSLESCEAVISRSGWSDDSLYVGLMGNANNAIGGQIDSGNFIYANKGFTWFGDLGAESHEVYAYDNVSHRYGYYRNTGEGANVVIMTTPAWSSLMPYGQLEEAGGVISEYYTSDAGMYAMLDNTAVYGGKATSATRGILLTNNRKTFVVQDDIKFAAAESCVWVAQTAAESISISSDKKTAFLSQNIDGKRVILRATIVEPGSSLTFAYTNAYTNLLTNTYKKAYSAGFGFANEINRDEEGLKKLIIKQDYMTAFQCSVVFEIVGLIGSDETVEYEYTRFGDWNSDLVREKFVATEVNEDVLGAVSLQNIIDYSKEAGNYVSTGYAWYNTRINEFFRAMVRVYDSVFVFQATGQIRDNYDVNVAYQNYVKYRDQYNSFRVEMNSYMTHSTRIARNLCGYN